jgi:hypothetical protein
MVTTEPGIIRRWGPGLAVWGLAATTVVPLWSLTTALPAVLDVRPGVLILSVLTALAHLWARRRAVGAPNRLLHASVAVVFGGVAAAAAYDLTLAYRAEDMTFTSGDVTLQATLYLPPGAGPHPAVVLVHGSGQQPRDEYRFYARAYARRGIAALAYDKRGSGASTGAVSGATYEMFAADAAAAVEVLRRHGSVDPGRVGLWGLSEGEWVAPLAARQVAPAFLVLVSPSAMTPAEQVGHEAGARVRRAGFGEDAAREATELYALVSAFQRSGSGREELNTRLAAASREPWFDAARYLDASVPEYERVRALEWFPAWRARMDTDGLAILSALRCPVLAQVGGTDPKNDGAGSLDRLRAVLAAGGNAEFTGRFYPLAGHGILEWRLGDGVPPPFFADGYLDDQITWVRQVLGVGPAG